MYATILSLCREFLDDEQASVDAANYVLMVTIIGIGIIAGLAAVRDSAAQQLGDIGAAMESLNQTYTVSMTFATMEPGVTVVREYGYVDDTGPGDVAGQGPLGIEICLPAEFE